MNRRTMLASMAAIAGGQRNAAAEAKPYHVSLIGDAFDGKAWRSGIRIELAEGWKTYWRMPGEAGIPPQFTWDSEPASGLIDIGFPVPSRFADASGETIGYRHEVVFPVTIEPATSTSLKLGLKLFFAVCKDICIPAEAEAVLDLGAAMRDPEGSMTVEEWAKAVPVAADIITSIAYETGDGYPVLVLGLSGSVDDIFVETATSAYFRAPQFSADGGTGRLRVDNVKDFSTLRGTDLKLTMKRGATGLEQTVTLP